MTGNGSASHAPPPARLSRVSLMPWIVLAVGVLASLAASLWQRADYDRSRESRLVSESERITEAVVSSVGSYAELNDYIAAEARPEDGSRLTQAQFDVFVDALVLPSAYPGIFGMAWADSVPSSQLQALIEDESVPVASLQDLRPDGSEEQSVVVTLAGPAATMAIARGVDARSFEPISQAIDRAVVTKSLQASAPFRIPLSEGPDRDDPPVLVFLTHPYFSEVADPSGTPGRVEQVDGFAATILDMDEFLNGAGGPLQSRYALTLSDADAGGERLARTANDPLPGGTTVTEQAEVFGRDWRFEYSEAAGVVYGERNLAAATLLGGLCVTFFVFVVVLVISRSERRAQRMVSHATHELSRRASTDSLTSLPNRSELVHRLNAALASGSGRLAPTVFFIDLDGFKLVNDSLGHSAGDELLVLVADRLRDAVRPEDTIARFGGDEFVVLSTGVVTQSHAIALAQRLQRSLEVPFVLSGREVYISSSIGIAQAEHGDSGEELISNADAAMYVAKEGGAGGHAVYEASVHRTAVERLTLQTELRRAMKRGELSLEYQPIYELATGRLSGVESLMRWTHPELGSVSPEVFIPLAEQSGLIRSLGAWAIEDACAQAARWAAISGGEPIPVSVNLSLIQLVGNGLEAEVSASLARHGIPPGSICLEVTEGAFLRDFSEVLPKLERIRSTGVKVAMDDFGTGYSSLAQIRTLPVDVLKLDRSFMVGVADDERDQAVVRAVVDLSRALGMVTVAEGVETEAQRDAAISLGVEHAQGWLWQKSLPARAIDDLIAGSYLRS